MEANLQTQNQEMLKQKPIQFKPKYYADACVNKKAEFYTYENINIEWGEVDNYEIIQKIGRGKYSDVFEGFHTKQQKSVVLKILKPIRKQKIKREIKILQNLKGGPNIIPLREILRDQASKTTTLVFDYVKTEDYKTLYPKFTDQDVKYYMYEIFKALDYCHSNGIMHRDIKPHNIMINHETKELSIIDWGLAEFYFPGKDYNVRVASRYFKGPELLLDYQYYDYSLDIWSLGVMFAGIREPFFQGKDNADQLEKIVRVLGTNELLNYVKKYNLQIPEEVQQVLGQHQKKQFSKFVTNENQHLAITEALDLLSKMLVYDHTERITAKDALNHPYFEQVRPKKK